MSIPYHALQSLIDILPSRNGDLYRAFRRYVDRYNGDNDDDMIRNGELRFMGEHLKGSTTVFDVGANVGDWAALALEINPALSLHCFEPSPTTFSRLAARSFPANVVRNNFGLSSASGERSLYVFGEGSGMKSLYRRQGLEDGWALDAPSQTETVWLDTLDHYCLSRDVEKIDFLKLDVEGHELEVLRGAGQMLARGRIDIIQLEYGGCNIDSRALLKDIFEFFGSLPYSANKINPRGLRAVERYDQRIENFQYQNWAFIRTVE